MSGSLKITLLGFGEVGQILGADLRATGSELSAWDPLFLNPNSAAARAKAEHVRKARDASDAASCAQLVISAVTAAETYAAAASVAPAFPQGAFYLDLNSASPGTKQRAASCIAQAGGRYVEAAVMAPVPPARLATPMLLGGPHAAAFAPVAEQLGLAGARVFSPELGAASAAKMCRSVVIKGLEALLTESLVSARHYGVEQAVLSSLGDLLPGVDWSEKAHYMISRSLAHGRRRGEEMDEVANTVREANLSPLMSAACAERQRLAAAFAQVSPERTLEAMLDRLLQRDSESPL